MTVSHLIICNTVLPLVSQNRQLKSQLEEYQSMGSEKDELLMRNASLSSKCQQLSTELKSAEEDRALKEKEWSQKCSVLQKELDSKSSSREMNELVIKLEESLVEKNKTIKLQKQRLTDIKKTFLQNQTIRADDQSNYSSGDERSPRHEWRPSARDHNSIASVNGRKRTFLD